MRPWKASVGLTASTGAVGAWALAAELTYLQPFGTVILTGYGWYIAAYGGMALATLAAGFYLAARAVGLGAVGRKVDVTEQAIRRGEGQDPALGEALARDDAEDYE